MKNASHKTQPIRMTLRDAQAVDSKTDWQLLKDMPDAAITLAAEVDSDNLPLDDPFFDRPPLASFRAVKRGQAADNPAD